MSLKAKGSEALDSLKAEAQGDFVHAKVVFLASSSVKERWGKVNCCKRTEYTS